MPSREAPVLVAPRSFGGTLRASAVAAATGRGLERAGLRAPDLCPVADGGEGTVEVLLPALGGELVPAEVTDAAGRPLRAHLALLDDGATALIEAVRDGAGALAGATSYGTGELICAAVDEGAAVILVAAGGPAPADGGLGALRAIADHGGVGRARLAVLCDVTTPWEAVAPAETAEAARLDAAAAELPRDPRGRPRTGAGGGLAGALWAAHGAVLEAGATWILEALDFTTRMRAARAVVTGEDHLHAGTLEGGIVGEICVRARQAGVPAHAVAGRNRLDAFDQRILDLQLILEAGTPAGLEAAGEALGAALREGAA